MMNPGKIKSFFNTTPNGPRENQDSGFTLIELSIALIVIGLLTAAFFAAQKTEQKARQIEKQQNNFTEVQGMLRDFVFRPQLGYYGGRDFNDRNFGGLNIQGLATPAEEAFASAGRLPCPADPQLGVGDDGFGQESLRNNVSIDGNPDDNNPTTGANNMTLTQNPNADICNITGGMARIDMGTAGDSPDDIIVGAMPFRTLGMNVFNGTDGYGQQFTYAVTAGATLYDDGNGGLASTTGTIELDNDGDGTQDGTATFVIVSHGETGAGANSIYGAQVAACDTTVLDGENCDGDEIFALRGFGEQRSGAEFYDDVATNSFRSFQNNDIWWDAHPNDELLYNINDDSAMQHRVIIGSDGFNNNASDWAQNSQVSIENTLNTAGTDSAHLSFFGEGADDQEHFGYITLDNPDDPNEQLGIFMALNDTTGDTGTINGQWTGENGDNAFMVLRSGGTAAAPGNTSNADEKFIFWADGQSFLNGNMGIRERLPETSLHITQETGNDQDGITLENLGGTQSRIVQWDDTIDQLQFRVGNLAGPAPADVDDAGDSDMVITSDGNVGIGRNDPERRLDITANTAGSGITISNNSRPALTFDEGGTQAIINLETANMNIINDIVTIQRDATATGRLSFVNNSLITQASILESSGILAINSTSDRVNIGPPGVAMIIDNATVTDDRLIAINFIWASDQRFKDVKGESPGIDLLKQISVYEYKWKANAFKKADNHIHHGVLAQELRDIPALSHLVHGKEGNIEDREYLKVDYAEMIPVLIQGLNDLHKQNTALKARAQFDDTLRQNQERIAALRAEYEALESYVQPAPAKGMMGGSTSLWEQLAMLLVILATGAAFGAGFAGPSRKQK